MPEALSAKQSKLLESLTSTIKSGGKCKVYNSDIFTEELANDFLTSLKLQHFLSNRPVSKEKFEDIFVDTLKSKHKVELADRCNPGHDVTVDGVKYNLKTQADKKIKENVIFISKFMELGKGEWGSNEKDFINLRAQFLEHLNKYDRIIIMRCLSNSPWTYEILEIPKKLLKRCSTYPIKIVKNSKHRAKPAYCHVFNNTRRIFSLYFDGGSERKLQVKGLIKKHCRKHATFQLTPPLP